MFSRILVPLDGTPLGERALPIAARIARATGGTLLLLRAINLAVPNSRLYGPVFTPYERGVPVDLEIYLKAARDYLHAIAEREILRGVSIEGRIDTAMAAPAILRAIQEPRVDLTVISSHGRRGVSRWALGSVAEQVVQHSPSPVLVLRTPESEREPRPADETHPPRVLVSLDGSLVAEAVLAPAAELAIALADPSRAELHLVSVVDPRLAELDRLPAPSEATVTRTYLERIAGELAAKYGEHLTVRTFIITSEHTADALIGAAEHSDGTIGKQADEYDVMAMGTHGRTGLERWALGSVTGRVLHATKVPVLVVRPTRAMLTSGLAVPTHAST